MAERCVTAAPAPVAARLPDLPHLPAALPRSGVSADARLALRQVLGDTGRALEVAFHSGVQVTALVRQRARAVERVVLHVWQACVGDAAGCALFAVGGFGRGALFPQSDVDLLVLAQSPVIALQARALEGFFSCLWDIGLKPGHAVRTFAQCRALAMADASVFTSLLDTRVLAGDATLSAELADLLTDLEVWPPDAFLAAKRDEQSARYARFGDTAYNLEPNVKDGPGGLRALDQMRWLGRRIAGAGEFAAMVEHGLLDPSERAMLEQSQATLWRYRFALHLAAGRPEERLLFDYQRMLATQFGYQDEHESNLAVEQFMQAYYHAATLTERLGAQLQERYIELLEPANTASRELDQQFTAVGARIEPRSADLFVQRPAAIVEVFALALDHPGLRGLSSETMRLLQQALHAHRNDFAENEDVLVAFIALLRRGAPAVDALASMNRHGVLAAMLPQFRRVVGRMQYDLFHVYTVDEHTLRVLRNIARFADDDSAAEFPNATDTLRAVEKPELLLLAALFHDIAKGRGGDHSVLGEQDARAFGSRLGLAPRDIDLVAWLVRWHLLMSVTAQRQDITDPEVVHRFASQIADRERLDHLYLLTIADIAGTNPKLWNEWKSRLLGDLHVAARYALRAGLSRPPHAEERARACRARALQLLIESGIDEGHARQLLQEFPPTSFLRHRPEQVARHALAIERSGAAKAPVVSVQSRSNRASSELFVCAADRDGLFAAITATLDRLGLNVVGARLLVSATGRVFDTFELLDATTLAALGPERASDLEATLTHVLVARVLSTRVVRRGLPRRLRHFQRAPQIAFSEVGAATQLALVTSDRPGLLAHVAQAFREARVRVHDARIATFGERAEDFFILTDDHNQPLNEARSSSLRRILLRGVAASQAAPKETQSASKEMTHAG